MMLISWPTLMNRPRSPMMAASMRRALRWCFSRVTRCRDSALRKRFDSASAI